MQSSNIRGKVAFVPWLAALVFGAAANAGWVVHELHRGPAERAQVQAEVAPVVVHIDHDLLEHSNEALERSRELRWRRAQRRTQARASCSPHFDAPRHQHDAPRQHHPEELAAWIEQRASYSYTIDRRALDYFAPQGLVVDRPSLDALALALEQAEPVELRNIRGGTALWELGLRNGDRLLSLMTAGDESFERVVLAVERRGRVVALSYELV